MAAFGGPEVATKGCEESSGQLTNRQYVLLGRAISSPDMEAIALGYMNIDEEIIKSVHYENRGNPEAFNRDILRKWAYQNPGPEQVEKLAHLLYKAARECSYVNPRKIQRILEVSMSTSPGSESPKISEEEFLTLAEKIRPFTEEAMKIEVAPWIKDYVVDMDELYTDLSLEKIHNKLKEEASIVKDYKELFAKCLAKQQQKSDSESLAIDSDDDRCHSISDLDEESHIYEDIDLDNTNNDDSINVRVGKSKSKEDQRVKRKKAPKTGKLSKLGEKLFKTKSKTTQSSTEKSVNHSSGLDPAKLRRPSGKTKTNVPKSEMGEKILGKGDPGMGKTTWCKKVGWDWARGVFTTFSLIFFVVLKLVKPGAAIENIIIEQNSYMKGLKITEKNLESILETFGNRCLLILDGIDEHALGSNEDVLRVIRREKLLSCNIIVTSRPHSTKEIEKYFPVIFSVKGFTYKKAEQFASKILSDKQKVETVLKFNPKDSKEDVPIHRCPILLSFMCVLIREDEIDLSDKTMHIGEIYLRMVRCLYKKFTIREGIEFEIRKFFEILMLIGELAFETLLSGHPFFQRKKVMSKVGIYAFDYGLLIGHEDAHKLFRDETADIFITFPHQSLQEFLGAFYFVGMMDKIGEKFITDAKKTILLTNPLFFRFSLWFLRNDKMNQTLKNNVQTYNYFITYGFEVLNNSLLDTKTIAPSLDIESTFSAKDEIGLEFLREILAKCDVISIIVLESSSVLNWLLESMGSMVRNIKFIKWADTEVRVDYLDKNTIGIDMVNGSIEDIDLIISYYKANECTVRLQLENQCETLEDGHIEDLSSLCMRGSTRKAKQHHFPSHVIHRQLTHLHVENVERKRAELFSRQLSKAINFSCLPCFSHLCFVDCESINGISNLLFETFCPEIRYLNLLGTKLTETDLLSLCLACNGPDKTMPKLSSLLLSLPNEMTKTANKSLFAAPWPNLLHLCLRFSPYCDANIQRCLQDAVKKKRLPKLNNLGIQHSVQVCEVSLSLDDINVESLLVCDCVLEYGLQGLPKMSSRLELRSCRGISGCLSSVLNDLPLSLHTLILSDCGLDMNALRHLIQASDNGKLPNLKLLDISWNGFTSLFMDNVTPGVSFSSLLELVIDSCPSVSSHWPNLKLLFLSHCTTTSLNNIIDGCDRGFFPNLRTICVETFQPYDTSLVRSLCERNIDCHRTFPQMIIHSVQLDASVKLWYIDGVFKVRYPVCITATTKTPTDLGIFEDLPYDRGHGELSHTT